MVKKFILLISGIIFITIIFFDYPKRIISRAILSHDLSLLTHSIFKEIKKRYSLDFSKENNKINQLVIINYYINNFAHPSGYNKSPPLDLQKNNALNSNNLDDGASWKLLHGSIWCDGVSDIFIRFAELLDVKAAIVFLYDKSGVSPHTIALADIENKTSNFEDEKKINETYIYDASYYFMPLTKNNKSINIAYMIKNKNEFLDYKPTINLLANEMKVFSTNQRNWFSSYAHTMGFYIVKFTPMPLLKKLYKFSIFINPDLNNDYKKYLIARVDHLLFDINEAYNAYSRIDNKNLFYDWAKYWQKNIIKNDYEIIKFENIVLRYEHEKYKVRN